MMASLVQAAQEAHAGIANGSAGDGCGGGGVNALLAVAESVQAALAGMEPPALPPCRGQERIYVYILRTALRRHCEEQLLPLAQPLAVALEAFYELPQQQAAARLAAAQAAATRSCAYLRCANLGASGGPGAGEGRGSKRCGACKTVW